MTASRKGGHRGEAQRDAVVARLGFCRTGPWRLLEDGRAQAPVKELLALSGS